MVQTDMHVECGRKLNLQCKSTVCEAKDSDEAAESVACCQNPPVCLRCPICDEQWRLLCAFGHHVRMKSDQ